MWVCRPLSTSLCLALARTHFPSPSLSLSPSLTHTHSLSLINAIGVFVRRGKLRKLGPQTPAESPAHTPHRSARSCVLTVVAVLGSRMSEPVFFQTLGRLALLCFSSQPQHKYSARTHIPPPNLLVLPHLCLCCLPVCLSVPHVCFDWQRPSPWRCAVHGPNVPHGRQPSVRPRPRSQALGVHVQPRVYLWHCVRVVGLAGRPEKREGGRGGVCEFV